MHLSKMSITRMIAETAGRDVDNLDAKNKMIPKAMVPNLSGFADRRGGGSVHTRSSIFEFCVHRSYKWSFTCRWECLPLVQMKLRA